MSIYTPVRRDWIAPDGTRHSYEEAQAIVRATIAAGLVHKHAPAARTAALSPQERHRRSAAAVARVRAARTPQRARTAEEYRVLVARSRENATTREVMARRASKMAR